MHRLFNNFYEPIMPNGTFAGLVTNQKNSTNSRVERHVANHVSYGRQLGILVDAFEVLVSSTPAPKDEGDAAKLAALKKLKQRVDGLKLEARESQVRQIIGELDELWDSDLIRCAMALERLEQKRSRKASSN